MNKTFLLILTVCLLTGPMAANAELVQSSTGVMLTFRHCIPGETVCDSVGPFEVGKYGGLPGEQTATQSHTDPAYGEARGSAQLTGAPGAAKISSNVTSSPGTRNGSNGVILQRYTNESANAEMLTFGATLTYEQTVPAENAAFSTDSAARSGANAELFIFSLELDSLEAGTTAEDNIALLLEEPDPGIIVTELGFASTPPFSNVTDSGTKTLLNTVTVEPGDSIWLWAILQGLVANGAEVSATLETRLEPTQAD